MVVPTPEQVLSARPAILRLGGYLRISDDPEDRGVGVAGQKQQITRFCQVQMRRGLPMEVIEWFTDNDKSGYQEGVVRPEYERMLAWARAGKLDGVIARAVDRFDRQEDRVKPIAEELYGLGLDIWTVKSGHHDLSTAAGRNAFALEARRAQMESEQISERERDAIDERLQEAGEAPNDWVIGRRRVYGFDVDPVTGARVVVPHEAEVIREAARRVLAGEGVGAVALDLNARGERTVPRPGAPEGMPWSAVTLRQMLTSHRMTGIRRHHRPRGRWQRGAVLETWEQETTWPRILDRETWDALQAVAHEQRQRKAGHRAARKYPLAGLLECGRCQHRLFGMPSNGKRVYRCSNDPRSARHGCGRNIAWADELEDFIARELFDLVRDGAARRRTAGLDREARQINEQLAVVRARLSALGERYIRGEVSDVAFAGAERATSAELDRLMELQANRLRSTPAAEVLAQHGDIEAQWESRDARWRQSVIAAALRPGERIVLLPADMVQGRRGTRRGATPLELRVATVPWRA